MDGASQEREVLPLSRVVGSALAPANLFKGLLAEEGARVQAPRNLDLGELAPAVWERPLFVGRRAFGSMGLCQAYPLSLLRLPFALDQRLGGHKTTTRGIDILHRGSISGTRVRRARTRGGSSDTRSLERGSRRIAEHSLEVEGRGRGEEKVDERQARNSRSSKLTSLLEWKARDLWAQTGSVKRLKCMLPAWLSTRGSWSSRKLKFDEADVSNLGRGEMEAFRACCAGFLEV